MRTNAVAKQLRKQVRQSCGIRCAEPVQNVLLNGLDEWADILELRCASLREENQDPAPVMWIGSAIDLRRLDHSIDDLCERWTIDKEPGCQVAHRQPVSFGQRLEHAVLVKRHASWLELRFQHLLKPAIHTSDEFREVHVAPSANYLIFQHLPWNVKGSKRKADLSANA